MKKQIRFGVFETNSSSTHSLCICTKEEFDKWVNGEVLYEHHWSGDNFVEIPKDYEENPDEYEDLQTYEQWSEDEYLEYYEESYTTPSGDEIIVFGKYGYEG